MGIATRQWRDIIQATAENSPGSFELLQASKLHVLIQPSPSQLHCSSFLRTQNGVEALRQDCFCWNIYCILLLWFMPFSLNGHSRRLFNIYVQLIFHTNTEWQWQQSGSYFLPFNISKNLITSQSNHCRFRCTWSGQAAGLQTTKQRTVASTKQPC